MDGSIRHGISLGKTLLNWTWLKKDWGNHGYKYINVTQYKRKREKLFSWDLSIVVSVRIFYRSTHFISWGARRSSISVFRVMRIFSDPMHIDSLNPHPSSFHLCHLIQTSNKRMNGIFILSEYNRTFKIPEFQMYFQT